MVASGVTKEGPRRYLVPSRFQAEQNIFAAPPFVEAVAKLVTTNPNVVSVPAAIAITVNASNSVGGRTSGHVIDQGSTQRLLPKDLRDTDSLRYLTSQAEGAIRQACQIYHLPATDLPTYQALVRAHVTPLGLVKPEKKVSQPLFYHFQDLLKRKE